MLFLILSIILYIIGVLGIIFGVALNNDPEAKLEYFLANGSTDPGTMWIIIGVVLLIVATIFLVLYIVRRANKKAAKIAKAAKENN